ncbi:hypothetical protein B0H14DRAFT_2617460 [Mycena olivaceomarginata]|nr:hypothetical protein B0H14DRAFT_2617460 [Mycena olivaceomarginata]
MTRTKHFGHYRSLISRHFFYEITNFLVHARPVLPLQEINVVVLSGPRAPNNIADAGASEDGDHLSTHEDCEVHISGLGDLAALAIGPVSFEPGMKTRMPLVPLKAVEGTLFWNLRLNYRNPRLNHWNPKRCIFIGIHWTPSGFQ